MEACEADQGKEANGTNVVRITAYLCAATMVTAKMMAVMTMAAPLMGHGLLRFFA
jgi:hypothetical protein